MIIEDNRKAENIVSFIYEKLILKYKLFLVNQCVLL